MNLEKERKEEWLEFGMWKTVWNRVGVRNSDVYPPDYEWMVDIRRDKRPIRRVARGNGFRDLETVGLSVNALLETNYKMYKGLADLGDVDSQSDVTYGMLGKVFVGRAALSSIIEYRNKVAEGRIKDIFDGRAAAAVIGLRGVTEGPPPEIVEQSIQDQKNGEIGPAYIIQLLASAYREEIERTEKRGELDEANVQKRVYQDLFSDQIDIFIGYVVMVLRASDALFKHRGELAYESALEKTKPYERAIAANLAVLGGCPAVQKERLKYIDVKREVYENMLEKVKAWTHSLDRFIRVLHKEGMNNNGYDDAQNNAVVTCSAIGEALDNYHK